MRALLRPLAAALVLSLALAACAPFASKPTSTGTSTSSASAKPAPAKKAPPTKKEKEAAKKAAEKKASAKAAAAAKKAAANEPAPPPSPPPPKGASVTKAAVFMKDLQFAPTTLRIVKGTTVTWINTDSVDHVIQGNGFPGSPGPIVPKDKYIFVFEEPGEYTYFDPNNPGMNGTISVYP